MKKNIFAVVLIGIISVSSFAQNAKKVFLAAPDSVTPLLTADNRADFFDFLTSKMKAEVKNRFQGKSEMTELTDDYINIQMTKSSTWQMKLLPVNDSTKIICVVSTVTGPTSDSNIRFYTSKWKPLITRQIIKIPTADQFFVAPVAKSDTDSVQLNYEAVRQQADIFFMKASLSKTEPTLTFVNTTPDFFGKDAAEKMKPFLRILVYHWEKDKFVALSK